MKNPPSVPLPDSTLERRRRWRMAKDGIARYGVAVGGVSVIIAILLIFFYLLQVVLPLFLPADAREEAAYPAPGGREGTLHIALDELAEVGTRYLSDGRVVFFATRDGRVIGERRLPGTDTASVVSVAQGDPAAGVIALGLADGRALLVKHTYAVSYPDDVRTITPSVEFPYGEEPLLIDEGGQPLLQLGFQDGEGRLLLAAATGAGRLLLAAFDKEVDFLSEEVVLQRSGYLLDASDVEPRYLLIPPGQRRIYVAGLTGELAHYDIADPSSPRLVERISLVDDEARLTALRFLIGGYSLLAGTSDGRIAQWFPVKDARNRTRLTKVREFHAQSDPIQDIAVEQRRRGFVVADVAGRVGIYHSTAERNLLVAPVSASGLSALALSPRADGMVLEAGDGRMHFWRIANHHPEVSLSALWEKVWYEGYGEPRYIWQSSSASNDFEPKFSFAPLAFGTIKAAFYAMLLAVPLAILGAIYTAYFMAPRMRRLVKPTIEIMEALPTVILGFLAGLWLAPAVEQHLPGIFALLLLMPVGILAFAYLWRGLPPGVRRLVPEGWEAALLIPVVLLIGAGALALSAPLEQWFFGGDMRNWLTTELGVDFDQRNSVVIGLAMGFAVIPTIFSITEDAIFSVPRHLTNGSLALGATPWQTLVRVVILTASPGIFSAVMIGLGRAVGETMIVLMATGNTPVMDFSMFQGMRTLSANIAVEMPESEVHSTHYRLLFLAAFVLFVFTFMFNTVAELVRQRLRKKYSSL